MAKKQSFGLSNWTLWTRGPTDSLIMLNNLAIRLYYSVQYLCLCIETMTIHKQDIFQGIAFQKSAFSGEVTDLNERVELTF